MIVSSIGSNPSPEGMRWLNALNALIALQTLNALIALTKTMDFWRQSDCISGDIRKIDLFVRSTSIIFEFLLTLYHKKGPIQALASQF